MLLRQLERYAPDARAPTCTAGRAPGSPTTATSTARSSTPCCAGDVHVAADALRRNWLALYSGGHAHRGDRWIDRLPRRRSPSTRTWRSRAPAMARAMGRPSTRSSRGSRWPSGRPRPSATTRERARAAAGVARQRAMLRLGQRDVGEAVRLRARGGRRAPARLAGGAERLVLPRASACSGRGATREAETRLRAYLDAVTPRRAGRAPRVRDGAAGRRARRPRRARRRRAARSSESLVHHRGARARPSTRRPSRCSSPRGSCCSARGQHRARRGPPRARRHARPPRRRPVEIAHALLWLGRCRARAGDAGRRRRRARRRARRSSPAHASRASSS